MDLIPILNKYNDLLKSGDDIEEIMKLINEEIGGYGVECITDEDAWVSHYWMYIIALYVNIGNTYDETIVYSTEDNELTNESWGDWYEDWEFKHPEEALDDI